MKKMTLIAFLILVTATLTVFAWKNFFTKTSGPLACTEEAKVCPDGSVVGRGGPLCEFAACPDHPGDSLTDTTNWKFYTDGHGLYFDYPETLPTTYTHPQNWPPTVTAKVGTFTCQAGGSEILPTGSTVKKMIGNNIYCIQTQSEGAAGSMYTTYTYTTAKADTLFTVSFTLRFVQCDNYDEPSKTACKQERASFNVDALADLISQRAGVTF